MRVWGPMGCYIDMFDLKKYNWLNGLMYSGETHWAGDAWLGSIDHRLSFYWRSFWYKTVTMSLVQLNASVLMCNM